MMGASSAPGDDHALATSAIISFFSADFDFYSSLF
jgi:hypothetical protein